MNINTTKGDSIEFLLRQIGAIEIKKVRGLLYFIKFKLDEDLEISYTYNINSKNKYFLQRIKPYPIPQGVFVDEYEVVSFIKKDLHKFNNAKISSNFKSFLEVSKKVNSINYEMEKLFLNYNVDAEHLLRLDKELNDILGQIEESKNTSERIYIKGTEKF